MATCVQGPTCVMDRAQAQPSANPCYWGSTRWQGLCPRHRCPAKLVACPRTRLSAIQSAVSQTTANKGGLRAPATPALVKRQGSRGSGSSSCVVIVSMACEVISQTIAELARESR
jgi:hypothetical protein